MVLAGKTGFVPSRITICRSGASEESQRRQDADHRKDEQCQGDDAPNRAHYRGLDPAGREYILIRQGQGCDSEKSAVPGQRNKRQKRAIGGVQDARRLVTGGWCGPRPRFISA